MISSFRRTILAGGQTDPGRHVFVAFCTYYIFSTYLLPSIGGIRPYSLAYFALAVPSWAFIWLSRRAIFRLPDRLSWLWWAFIAATVLVALLQGNPSLAYNGLYMGMVALAIVNAKGYLRTEELNAIFLATIAGSIIVYLLGVTEYGFIPGQAAAPSCHQGLAFRISLFRVPSESAALAMFVLIWNVYVPSATKGAVRWCIMALALYFIVFGGIRTAIIALVVVSPALIYALVPTRSVLVKGGVAILLPVFIVGAGIYQLATVKEGAGQSSFIYHYVLRTDSCEALLSSEDEKITNNFGEADIQAFGSIGQVLADQGISVSWLATTFNRHCAGKYQFRLFLDHPFTGNHRVHPEEASNPGVPGCTKSAVKNFCDACVLATYWLSKGGLAGMVLISIYLFLLWRAFRLRSPVGVVTLVAFGIILQGWGVMFTPYNFTFYMLASVASLIGVGDRSGKPAPTVKGNP